MSKIKVEVQYFSGCPNSSKMISRVKEALSQIAIELDYKETLVESNETAYKLKFRGSPTLIVDSIDFEGMPEPDKPALSCRTYLNGLPSIKNIISFIEKLNKEKL